MHRLGAHGSMPTRQRALVGAAWSAVHVTYAAIAEIKMQGHIIDAVSPGGGSAGDGPQIALDNLTRTYEDIEARELLVTEILEMPRARPMGSGGCT